MAEGLMMLWDAIEVGLTSMAFGLWLFAEDVVVVFREGFRLFI